MSFQKIHASKSQSSQPQHNSSQSILRPFAVQAKEPESELTGLQNRQNHGTTTPIEQEKLGVVQAKMQDSLKQEVEKASRFGHSLATIAVHPPNASVSTPIQPETAIQWFRAGNNQQSSQRSSVPTHNEVVQRAFFAALAPQKPVESSIQAKEEMPEKSQAVSEVSGLNKTGLSNPLKTGIEHLSGYAMDDVRVHFNSDKPVQLQAHAYAQGTDIHIAPGQENHLPHEAWHVVQQKQGRVKPTIQMRGKVNINDDIGLEKEADEMGAKAMQLQSFGKSIQIPSAKSDTTHTNAPIQRKWENGDGEERRWDKIIDGVRWYADEKGLMRFEIEDPQAIKQGNLEDYSKFQGQKKSWVEWNKISLIPSPAFDNEKQIDSVEGHEDVEDDDPSWKKWNEYMTVAIGSAQKLDDAADVHKTPGFDASDVRKAGPFGKKAEEPLLKSEGSETLGEYIADFKIVTKQEYNIKLWEIAEKLAEIENYTCIVSEAGKSNFWITARILKRVKYLGGKSPKRIISVPTQEKGIKDNLQQLNLNLNEKDGDIVFLDDGSFSGSQLMKLINKVMQGARRNAARYGLVARSEVAKGKIEDTKSHPKSLAEPITIEKFRENAMNAVQKGLGLEVKPTGGEEPPDGDYLLSFYYKVADKASVRNMVLTTVEDALGRKPISGYKEPTLDLVTLRETGKNQLIGTEPYKPGNPGSEKALGLGSSESKEVEEGRGETSIPKKPKSHLSNAMGAYQDHQNLVKTGHGKPSGSSPRLGMLSKRPGSKGLPPVKERASLPEKEISSSQLQPTSPVNVTDLGSETELGFVKVTDSTSEKPKHENT